MNMLYELIVLGIEIAYLNHIGNEAEPRVILGLKATGPAFIGSPG